MDVLYVDETWSRIVPAGSPDARFGVQRKDAKRLGLLSLDEGEEITEPSVLTSANEVKEAERPADKQAPKPADKSVKRTSRKT